MQNKIKTKTVVFLFFLMLTLISGTVVYSNFYVNKNLPEYVNKVLDDDALAVIKGRNSDLISYAHLVSQATFPRTSDITSIVIHHTAGPMTLQDLGRVFSDRDRKVSANYGIDKEGLIGCYVEEADRPWSSSDETVDDHSVTIEVSNDSMDGDWHVSDQTFMALVELCVDICERNGIEKLDFTGDASGNLLMHKMFADTTCPGPYLESRMVDLAHSVNKRLK